MKKRVIIESPYKAIDDLLRQTNIDYARRCVLDSILRGEAPVAFHLLYTQPGILDDTDPTQRHLGIGTSRTWYECADICAVYIDLGISTGMQDGMAFAKSLGLTVEQRRLPATKGSF